MPRIAIVTGAASGIGRALAAAGVDRGGHVVVADIDGAGAKEVADRLDARGPGSAEPATLDVRDAGQVRLLIEGTRTRHDRLDFLFNNAGVGVGGRVDELQLDHWQRSLDVNLRGVVHGVQAGYPLMVEQGFGHLVNTASLSGLIPSPMLAPYATAKHAVVGLSTSLRAEAREHGVTVHAVCPGLIDTPIIDSHGPDDLPPVPSAQDRTLRGEMAEVGVTPYSPATLAEDVMRGLARDDAVIVAPWQARLTWRAYRLAPKLVHRVAGVVGVRAQTK